MAGLILVLVGQWQDGGTWSLPAGTVFSWQYQTEERGQSLVVKIKVKLKNLGNADYFGLEGAGIVSVADPWTNDTIDDNAIPVWGKAWVASTNWAQLFDNIIAVGEIATKAYASEGASLLEDLPTLMDMPTTSTAWRTKTPKDTTIQLILSENDVLVDTTAPLWITETGALIWEPSEVWIIIWISVNEGHATILQPDYRETYWVCIGPITPEEE